MVESNTLIKLSSHFSMYPHSKIGNGAFREIYLGKNIKTDKEIAIKLESRKIFVKDYHKFSVRL